MRPRILIMLGFSLLACAGALFAQDGTTQRVRELEARVSRLEGAQETLPKNDFHIAGYTSITMSGREHQPSSFAATFNPLFLFKAGERFLFEAEMEFEIVEKKVIQLEIEEPTPPATDPVLEGFKEEEEIVTETKLEYAHVDYMVADSLIIVAGKFLLPLGTFGERGHPSWINKLPVPPPIYGGHGGFEGAIIPVLSDFGVQVRGGFRLNNSHLSYAVYSVNGPRPKEEREIGHVGGHGHGAGFPVVWEASPEDNNNNKAGGFRLSYLPLHKFEVGISHYSGKVEENQSIALSMVDLALVLGGLEIRSEYLRQDTKELAAAAKAAGSENIPAEETTGYYVQVSYNFGLPEVVVRYGAVSTETADVGTQTGLGLNFWLEPSIVLKLSAISDDLHDKPEKENAYFAQLAFGF